MGGSFRSLASSAALRRESIQLRAVCMEVMTPRIPSKITIQTPIWNFCWSQTPRPRNSRVGKMQDRPNWLTQSSRDNIFIIHLKNTAKIIIFLIHYIISNFWKISIEKWTGWLYKLWLENLVKREVDIGDFFREIPWLSWKKWYGRIICTQFLDFETYGDSIIIVPSFRYICCESVKYFLIFVSFPDSQEFALFIFLQML